MTVYSGAAPSELLRYGRRMDSDPSSNPARAGAVVFVHGFTASPAVWKKFLGLLRSDSVATSFQLLTFAYPTRLVRLNPRRAIPSMRACAELLDSYLARHVGATTPLVLVTHSQGGLVVQRLIADMLEAGRGAELRRLVRVVMFACPNDGSDFFLGVRRLILGRNPQERRLRPLDEMINDTKRVVLQRAVYATSVTDTTCPVHVTAYVGIQDGIVRRGSAKGLFPNTATLAGDHSSIIQPVSTQDESYLALASELRAASEHAYVMSAQTTAAVPNTEIKSTVAVPDMSEIVQVHRPAEVPRPSPQIYGREDDLAAIATGLAYSDSASSSRLVVLSGRGGSGKTCLVRHAALHATPEFPDGQLYYDLANVPTEMGSAIAALDHLLLSLGTPPDRLPSSPDGKAALYQSLLAGWRILVVIENAADPDGASLLLPAMPGSAALVTSRRRLDSLDADVHLHVQELDAAAAVLYLDDTSHRSSGEPGHITAAQLKTLAEACGYFPLALKIAGALLRRGSAGSIEDLIRTLRDDKRRLDALALKDLELRSTLVYAYALLTNEARTLLRRLSLLPHSNFGPWLPPVALDGAAVNPTKALDELVEVNLIDPTVDGRFDIHDLVVDFARERIAVEGGQEEMPVVTELLINSYASRARECRRILEPERPPFGGSAFGSDGGEVQPQSIADSERWLEREHANLVTIMSFAADKGLTRALIDIANSLPTYFIIRGTWNDWHAGLMLATRAAEATGDQIALGYSLQALANVERTLGYGTGRALIERSYRCFSDANDLEGQAYTLNDVGLVEMYDGEWTDSIGHLEQSEALLNQIGNDYLALHPMRNRGIAYLEMGHVLQAISQLERVAYGFSTKGDGRWRAFTLGDLGKAYRLAGRTDEAESSLRESISLLVVLHETRWCAATKIRYGDLMRATGKTTRAREVYREAIDAFEALSDPLWAARALGGMSLADADAGYLDNARSELDRSLVTFRRFGSEADECWAQVCRFRVLHDTDTAAANDALAHANRIAVAMGYDSTYVQRLLTDAGPDVR